MKNATKTNEVITVKSIYDDFKNATIDKVIKINFSDAKSQQYCGFDDFSVNLKKNGYNVYMNTANTEICKSIDKSLTIDDNSKNDNTKKSLRSYLIKFTDYTLLKKCIIAVAKMK